MSRALREFERTGLSPARTSADKRADVGRRLTERWAAETRAPTVATWHLALTALLLTAACGGRAATPRGAGGRAGSGGSAPGEGGGPGGGGVAEAACSGAADPRLIVAPQRILLLTVPQVVGTVGYLFGDAAAAQVRSSPALDLAADTLTRFPPSGGEDATISEGAVISRDQVGQIVGRYVLEHFGDVTACAPPIDACALAYLDVLAARAYRRALTADEHAALGELYATLREQDVDGYLVTASVEEATQYAVYALVTAPQLLWRTEIGGQSAAAASARPSVTLTDDELATAVSFFLTDRPPDDQLLAAARAGTLHTSVADHVARILDTQAARDWLRSVIEIYLGLNRLPTTPLGDRPGLTDPLLADMRVESRLFLDEALWRGDITDLVASRVAFLNTRLATAIYDVPIPAGATDGAFARTTLPADRRAGLLTNAGFLTTIGTPRQPRVGVRGAQAAAALLCLASPPLTAPGPVSNEEAVQIATLDTTTAQQQVAARRRPECLGCHETMDALGVALDAYDDIGRYRTVDDRGQAVDTHTPLPAVLGGGTAAGAVETAEAIAKSPAFVACMARTVLQQAMTDASAAVDVPLPPQQAGCAVADLAARFNSGGEKTFGALVRAAAASPAFAVRRVSP